MQDGRALTKFPDADEEKKHYGSEEIITDHAACDLQLCDFQEIENPIQGGTVKSQCVSVWTAWTKWGKCNKDCGDEGNRKRTRWIIVIIPPVAQTQIIFSFRKCVGACDETKEGKDCRPARRSFTNESVTNEVLDKVLTKR